MENPTNEMSSDSKKKSKFKIQLNIDKESVYVLLLLAIVNWVSHYLYFMRFGLYEDDYANVGIYLGINLPQLLGVISARMTDWIQGHPFAFLPVLFMYIGELLGGFQFIYIIAFLIVTINSFLLYKILKKVFRESSVLAISGALAFSLFPPDTTKLYLMHVFVLQIAITFFLSATLLYLNNKKILAYLTITLAILTYESPFMLFFGVPFLAGRWDKKFRKEYLKHFIILCFMIALVFFYRTLTGESRAMEASGDLTGVFTRVITGIIAGPVFNIFLFIRAPVAALYYLIPRSTAYWWYYDYIYFFLSGCFVLFLWLFYKLKPDYISKPEISSITTAGNSIINEDNKSVNEYFRKIIKLLIAGIILICLGYSVSFTHYLYILMGRLTSVHLAASIGGSIIFACVCASIFFLAERNSLKKYAVILISAYLTLLVGYNTYAQKEFVESWSFQKNFWSEIIKLSPDLQDNTVILSNIPKNKLYVTRKFIFPFQTFWNKLMMQHLYYFPQKWQKPFYQNVEGKMEDDIHITNGEFMLKSEYFPPFALKDSNVIFIKMDENNNLVRVDSSVTINGKKLYLKPPGENTVNELGKTKLYDLMINPE